MDRRTGNSACRSRWRTEESERHQDSCRAVCGPMNKKRKKQLLKASREARAPVSFSLAPCDCSVRICLTSRFHNSVPPQTGFVFARVSPVADSSESNMPFTSKEESTGKCRPSWTTAVNSNIVVPAAAAGAATMTTVGKVNRHDILGGV